jgi:PAS domain S-box-containing protein
LVITRVVDVDKHEQAVKNAGLISAVVESSDDAIIGATIEGIITSWNPAAERMYGYTRKEIIGRSGRILTPDDRTDEFLVTLARAREGRTVQHLESMRIRKDGTLVPISLTVAPIHDDDGGIVGVSVVHRDATVQRQALALAQRLGAIVEGSDDAIISSTLEGIVTSWNRAAEELFGYSSKEIIGTSAETVSPKDRIGEMKAILGKVRAGQHVEHLETIRVRKDQTVFPVSLTVSPIRDADDQIVGASLISRDMTELKRAERYARSLIEAGLDPLVTISPDGEITDVNEATVKVTGLPRNKLIGTDFSAYFTDPDKAHEGYQRVFAKGSVTDYPLTIRHRDGTLTDVLYNATLYRDFNGKVLGVFAAARDVTEQTRAKALARLAAAIEFSGEAIISTTLEGIITSWNPAAERLFGYSNQEIIGKPGSLLMPADRAGEVGDIMAKIRTGEEVVGFETSRARKDGSVFPISLTITPIRDADGAIIGASSTPRNITEQKRTFETAQRMAAIVEDSADAIISQTIEGIITSWNPAAERLYGYPGDEIIGKSIGLLSPEGRIGEVTSILARIKTGRPVEHHEAMRVRKDGRAIGVSLTISPIRSANGAIVGASVIHHGLARLEDDS